MGPVSCPETPVTNYRSTLAWPLNMGPIGCPKTSPTNYRSTLAWLLNMGPLDCPDTPATINLCSVTSQKSEDFIDTAAEVWSHASFTHTLSAFGCQLQATSASLCGASLHNKPSHFLSIRLICWSLQPHYVSTMFRLFVWLKWVEENVTLGCCVLWGSGRGRGKLVLVMYCTWGPYRFVYTLWLSTGTKRIQDYQMSLKVNWCDLSSNATINKSILINL